MAVSLLLKRENIRAETACDGESAIERLEAEDFEVLISDIEMPNIGGIELLEWATANRPKLPVILTSGSVGGHIAQEGLRKGARNVLAKPFVPGEMVKLIAEIVGVRA